MSQSPPNNPLNVFVVGVNHRSAPLEVREALAFPIARMAEALDQFKRAHPGAELVILSTCNRVELYAGGSAAALSAAELTEFLATVHATPLSHFRAHVYLHEGRAAVEHLFRVAASLDSMVIGETQILAQVKSAYQAACEAGTVGHGCPREGTPSPHHAPSGEAAPAKQGGIFHHLFQRAFAAAKAVHEHTDLAAGRVSVASVAVELARSVFDRFDDKTVLCIGAGKMSALVLRHLRELGPRHLRITNRSHDRATALAAQCGGAATAVEFTRLDDWLTEADIILTSTGSTEPIITAPRFKALLKRRRYRPAVIVDIAVPRDVAPDVAGLPNVYLYNIDDLDQVAGANRDKRSLEIERSHALLEGHIEQFFAWHAARDAGPHIRAFFDEARGLVRAQLDEFLLRHPDVTEAQRRDLERLLHRVVGKMLHGPISQLARHPRASMPVQSDHPDENSASSEPQ